jgi:hypothetical protein
VSKFKSDLKELIKLPKYQKIYKKYIDIRLENVFEDEHNIVDGMINFLSEIINIKIIIVIMEKGKLDILMQSRNKKPVYSIILLFENDEYEVIGINKDEGPEQSKGIQTVFSKINFFK